MGMRYHTQSRFMRLASFVAATLIAGSLFAAVALGLTGTDGLALALAPAATLAV